MDRETEHKAGRAYGIGMSIFVLVFGIIWCVGVAATGAWFMLLFGFAFVGFAAYRLVMMLKLSKPEKKDRDPWDRPSHTPPSAAAGFRHCPYCGENVEEKFVFCPICGRRLG